MRHTKFWTFLGCQNSRGGNARLPPLIKIPPPWKFDKNIPIYGQLITAICLYPECEERYICIGLTASHAIRRFPSGDYGSY